MFDFVVAAVSRNAVFAILCPEGVAAEGEVAVKTRLRLRELRSAIATDSVWRGRCDKLRRAAVSQRLSLQCGEAPFYLLRNHREGFKKQGKHKDLYFSGHHFHLQGLT